MARLPALLKPFFWDYDFGRLDWETDKELIIQRVLSEGTWPAIQWLRAQLADDTLGAWLRERRGAGLSPRQLRFWELVLDLPHREVSGWLASRGPATWDRRVAS